MTWLWVIFSSLLLGLPVAAASISGVVRLADSLDPAVRKRQDYSGVVVWMQPRRPGHEDFTAVRLKPARMEQKGKRFVPHILAIPVGTGVNFPNLDPIFHSAFSNFSGQTFDLGLYAPGTSRTITFTRAGIVRIFCNIHPAMSAVIVVLKYPWFSVTDPSGNFAIPNVPDGEYQLHVYHERATHATLEALARKVMVAEHDLELPPVTISETGYLEQPHKNKYGKDYPPVADENGLYSLEHR